jgi:ligand-binding SRPBCC domain-containing protein
MEHTLDTVLDLPLPVNSVFAFFAEAANLERITPPELHFEIVSSAPITIKLGTLIEYRLRLLGLSFGWASSITEWDPPRRFVDEQIRGPYGLWVHTHTFMATPSGTRIEDHVRYRLPLSPLSEVGYPIVRWQLKRIFAYREQAVRDALLGSDQGRH